MKWIFRILCLLFIYGGMSTAQTEHIVGNVAVPNASTFNGYLRIKLTGANLKNICTTPFVSVPTMMETYPIVNGAIQGASSANFLSTDCLSPRIPYYVEVSDTNNIVQSTDNWYLPRTVTGSVDVGAMQEQHFGGPITVAIPYGIIQNPSVGQSITQAPGTSLNINTSSGGKAYYNGVELNTIDLTTLALTQLSINGASTAYPLNVNGLVNASGYLIGGSGGVVGQCVVSNGTVGGWGTCSPPFPSLYYQFQAQNSSILPQESILNHTSAFLVIDEGGGATLEDLAAVGTPGTYTNVNGITTNQYGQVTNVATGGGSISTRVCNSNGCFIRLPDGTLDQWGTSNTVPSSGLSSVLVVFPTPFSSTAISSGQVSVVANFNQRCTTGSDSGCGVYPTSLGTNTVTMSTEIDTGAGSVRVYWYAKGY